MKALKLILKIVHDVPLLGTIVNRAAVDYIASRTAPRPRPYSLWSAEPKPAPADQQGPVSDYTSWPSLTDKSFSGRHLPPASRAYGVQLPLDRPFDFATNTGGEVTALFQRTGPMVTDRSSLLFMFFAQWFTDSVLRVDPVDRRKNTSNHDIDLCQIYGLKEDSTRLLRAMQGGRLKSQMIDGEEHLDYLMEADGAGGLKVKDCYAGLPYVSRLDQIFPGIPDKRKAKLYATGLERGNSSIGYVAISTLFMREHNRIAGELAKRNPSWNDERLFQTARNINIVLLLKIVVEDYINHIAGDEVFRLDTKFAEHRRWYRTNWIAIEFDILYRWHSLVPDSMSINGSTYPPEDFRNNNGLLEEAGIGTVIAAASRQHAGRIGLFNSPSFLWGAEYQSLKMSRDFRVRPYNDYRERFGMNRLKSFEELTKDPKTLAALKGMYSTIDEVEYLVGIFAEDRSGKALFGSLLDTMVAYDAFTQIFTNPLISRYIYNAQTFTDYGLELIAKTSKVQALVDRNLKAGVRASLGV